MKKLFIKIGNWLKSFFTESFDWLEINADYAVQAVNIVKKIINNPVVDMAVALTPTTIDDKILAAAKSYIARAAADLLIVYNILKGSETPEEVLRKLTNYVSGLTDDQKAIFYVQLSGKVMQILADGKVTLAEAITITQYIFKKYHQDK